MDGWDSILTALPGVGGYGGLGIVLAIAIRMVVKADSRYNVEVRRYNAEVKDHEKTQTSLDEERNRRRKAEDDLSEVMGNVRRLEEKVAKLEARLTEALSS